MRISTTFSLSLVSSLLLSTSALPLWSEKWIEYPLQRRQAPAYSVVAVDGGSSSSIAPPATTITDAVTHTVLLTVTDKPSTIIVTITPPTNTIPASTAAAVTVTVMPKVTSTAYDDGMWHTTYFKPVTVWSETTSAVSAVQISSTSSATPASLANTHSEWEDWNFNSTSPATTNIAKAAGSI